MPAMTAAGKRLVVSLAITFEMVLYRPLRKGPENGGRRMHWFSSFFRRRALRDAKREMMAFVGRLAAMDDQDVGLLLAIATDQRHALKREGWDLLHPSQSLSANPRLLRDLELVISMHGKKSPSAALAAMIWVHTCRTVEFPELSALARTMWARLAAGFPHTEVQARWAGVQGRQLDFSGYDTFPEGMAPRALRT